MKNKKLLPVIIALSLPISAQAGFPQIDAPNIAADVWGNIQKIGEGIQKSGAMDKAMMFGKEMFGLENMTTNNAAANMVARQNAARQEIQNTGIAEQFAATPNVCSQVSFSFALGDIGCKAESSSTTDLGTPEHDAFISNDDSQKDKLAKKLVEDIQETYPSMFSNSSDSDTNSGSDVPDGPDEAPSIYSTNANALFSSADAFLALDHESYSSMSDFISLIVPDYSFRDTFSNLDSMTDGDQLYFLSVEAKRAVPEQALKSILGLRTTASALAQDQGSASGNQTSKLFSMSQAIKDAASESAIYAISVGETSTVTQLYRQRVLNLARAVELQLESFKKDLEFEGVMATRLSLLMEK